MGPKKILSLQKHLLGYIFLKNSSKEFLIFSGNIFNYLIWFKTSKVKFKQIQLRKENLKVFLLYLNCLFHDFILTWKIRHPTRISSTKKLNFIYKKIEIPYPLSTTSCLEEFNHNVNLYIPQND